MHDTPNRAQALSSVVPVKRNTLSTWHPVAATDVLAPGKILPATLEGRSFVLWRSKAGVSVIWEDRCLHRGMRLSFGTVRGDTLLCPYHGWTFGSDGQCRHIPAHPDFTPSRAARTRVYGIAEAQGYIWSSSDEPDAPFRVPPALDTLSLHPVRTLHVAVDAADVTAALAAAPLGAQRPGSGLPRVEDARIIFGVAPTPDDRQLPYVVIVQPTRADACAIHLATPAALDRADTQYLAAALVAFRLDVVGSTGRPALGAPSPVRSMAAVA